MSLWDDTTSDYSYVEVGNVSTLNGPVWKVVSSGDVITKNDSDFVAVMAPSNSGILATEGDVQHDGSSYWA